MVDIIKMGIILAIFTIVAAFSLDKVNSITKVKIEQNRLNDEAKARKEVIIPKVIYFKNIPNGKYSHNDRTGKISFVLEAGKDINNLELRDITFQITPDILKNIMTFLSNEEKVSLERDFLVRLKNSINNKSLDNKNLYFIIEKIIKAISDKIEFKQIITFSFQKVDDPSYVKLNFDYNKEDNTYISKDLKKKLIIKKTPIGFKVISYGNKKFSDKDKKKIIDVYIQENFQRVKVTIDLDTLKFNTYYLAYIKANGKENILGYVLKIVAKGYAGDPIEIVVGLNKTTILGIKVLSHKETPGLGSKMLEIKEGDNEPWFQSQFRGKKVVKNGKFVNMKVDKDGGDIQSITAATLTSRGVTNGLNSAIKNFYDSMN